MVCFILFANWPSVPCLCAALSIPPLLSVCTIFTCRTSRLLPRNIATLQTNYKHPTPLGVGVFVYSVCMSRNVERLPSVGMWENIIPFRCGFNFGFQIFSPRRRLSCFILSPVRPRPVAVPDLCDRRTRKGANLGDVAAGREPCRRSAGNAP